MIITIDGPAGAGKSSVSKLLAARLGFEFLDTGAMYRAVTYAAMDSGVSFEDTEALTQLASTIQIAFMGKQVFLDGKDVSEVIRAPEVTRNVSVIADTESIREHLVRLQREIAKCGNYVCEGRDQGTVAFPDSPCKFFLTASAEERAGRRVQQLRDAGKEADFEVIVAEQNLRDEQDYNRHVGALKKAHDAIELDTDHKTIDEVVDEMEMIVLLKMKSLKRQTVSE